MVYDQTNRLIYTLQGTELIVESDKYVLLCMMDKNRNVLRYFVCLIGGLYISIFYFILTDGVA